MASTAPDGEGRPAKRIKFDYFETITVLVGLEDTKFTVPKGIVGDESQFSQLACTGKWKEAAEQIVRLPEANSHSFGVFVGWLHTSVLEFSVTAEDDPLPKYDRDVSAECYDLVTEAIVDCFILGDMLQCQRCCNALVDELIRLIEGCGWLPGMDLHKEVLVKLLHSSTMRKLMADYIAFDLQPQEFLENASEYPADLVLDIAKASIVSRGFGNDRRAPASREKCFYHDHKDLSKKYS